MKKLILSFVILLIFLIYPTTSRAQGTFDCLLNSEGVSELCLPTNVNCLPNYEPDYEYCMSHYSTCNTETGWCTPAVTCGDIGGSCETDHGYCENILNGDDVGDLDCDPFENQFCCLPQESCGDIGGSCMYPSSCQTGYVTDADCPTESGFYCCYPPPTFDCNYYNGACVTHGECVDAGGSEIVTDDCEENICCIVDSGGLLPGQFSCLWIGGLCVPNNDNTCAPDCGPHSCSSFTNEADCDSGTPRWCDCPTENPLCYQSCGNPPFTVPLCTSASNHPPNCDRPPNDYLYPNGIDCYIGSQIFDCFCCSPEIPIPTIVPISARSATCVTSGGDMGINTAVGCVPVDDSQALAAFIIRWGLGIGGGIAFVLIAIAGIQIVTSSGNPERLQNGKNLLTAAISGIILLIFSTFILQLVGVDILRLPGFV